MPTATRKPPSSVPNMRAAVASMSATLTEREQKSADVDVMRAAFAMASASPERHASTAFALRRAAWLAKGVRS